MIEIVEADDGTPRSAMKTADEVLGYCASLALASNPLGGQIMVLIKEAQRRLRRHINPEMFDAQGRYR